MTTLVLPVTLLTAALLALVFIILSVQTIQARFAGGVSIGDGNNELVRLRMRIHANFAEYVPLVLVMMALVEAAGGAPFWLHILGLAFVVVRISHAFGMTRPAPNPFRIAGTMGTLLTLAGLAGWALAIAVPLI